MCCFQLRELQAGVNRDNMEALQAKEETKKLKTRMGDVMPRLAELEAEVRIVLLSCY